MDEQALLLNSTQLELELDDVRLNLPWGGRSPRGLTRAATSVILKARAAESMSEFVDPAQSEIFVARSKRRPQYEGAPLLRRLENG